MGREEGGGFRMGNTCFKIIKLKTKQTKKQKKESIVALYLLFTRDEN